MIHYRISPLDSNKTILEQLEDIKKYLTENPQYQVFYYNGNYINTTNTYEVSNIVLNARTINKGDIVLFANSYYAVVDAIGNNNFVVEHAIEMNSQAILDLRNFVISNYQTKLNFDSTPTLGSNNPVTSDGIKKAITETIQTEHQVPSGGTKSQVLGKTSNTDYDYNWIDLYPVGSIYMSVNDTSPASLFGGSWEKISGRFLIGSGSPQPNNEDVFGNLNNNGYTFTNEHMGGSYKHQLTEAEMPKHHHEIDSAYAGIGDGGILQRGWKETTEGRSFATTNIGNNEAHTNMPPYLVVNMWKRIA